MSGLKNLGFHNLKGLDKAQVDTLLRSKGFDLHLALVEKHMCGDAMYEHNRYGYSNYGDDYASDGSEDSGSGCGWREGGGKHHEMEDCHETSTNVMKWINVQDVEVTMKGLDIDLDEEMLNNEEELFGKDKLHGKLRSDCRVLVSSSGPGHLATLKEHGNRLQHKL